MIQIHTKKKKPYLVNMFTRLLPYRVFQKLLTICMMYNFVTVDTRLYVN